MAPHQDEPGWCNKPSSILALNSAVCFIRLLLIKLFTVGWAMALKKQFNKSDYKRGQQQKAVN